MTASPSIYKYFPKNIALGFCSSSFSSPFFLTAVSWIWWSHSSLMPCPQSSFGLRSSTSVSPIIWGPLSPHILSPMGRRHSFAPSKAEVHLISTVLFLSRQLSLVTSHGWTNILIAYISPAPSQRMSNSAASWGLETWQWVCMHGCACVCFIYSAMPFCHMYGFM